MELSDFDVSDELSINGTWIPLNKNTKLLIARLNNEKYRDYVKKKTNPYKSAMRNGTIDDDMIQEIVVQALARHVLLGWDGLTEKGAVVPYTVHKAEQLLRDKEPFRDLVTGLANDQANFKAAETEDSEKN